MAKLKESCLLRSAVGAVCPEEKNSCRYMSMDLRSQKAYGGNHIVYGNSDWVNRDWGEEWNRKLGLADVNFYT